MASRRKSKKSVSKIPPKTAERIVATSLQHPELGARRLVPLLKKKRISESAASHPEHPAPPGPSEPREAAGELNARSKKTRKPKSPPKKPATKITDDVAGRICEISLQNPEAGARGLVPLLHKQGIFAPSAVVYRILKRCGLQTRESGGRKPQKPSRSRCLSPRRFAKRFRPRSKAGLSSCPCKTPTSAPGVSRLCCNRKKFSSRPRLFIRS